MSYTQEESPSSPHAAQDPWIEVGYSLENVTDKGNIPIPNDAAPSRPAVKTTELRLMIPLRLEGRAVS